MTIDVGIILQANLRDAGLYVELTMVDFLVTNFAHFSSNSRVMIG